MRRCALVAVALVAVALVVASVATAQVSPRAAAFEARVDGILARRVATTHLGLGAAWRASRNLEVHLVVAGGVTMRDERDDTNPSARADMLARFAPAPSSRDAWSAYASGGVGGLFERGATGRGLLVLLVGARGRRTFVEAGLGGGLRLGAGVRF